MPSDAAVVFRRDKLTRADSVELYYRTAVCPDGTEIRNVASDPGGGDTIKCECTFRGRRFFLYCEETWPSERSIKYLIHSQALYPADLKDSLTADERTALLHAAEAALRAWPLEFEGDDYVLGQNEVEVR